MSKNHLAGDLLLKKLKYFEFMLKLKTSTSYKSSTGNCQYKIKIVYGQLFLN